MSENSSQPVAVVGVSAIMPNAPTGPDFWSSIREGRYGITDVPPDRWDANLFYDPDPSAPDKTYSRIGGWVRDFIWDPRTWRLPLPPAVAAQMDTGQQWSVSAARAALVDAGWPEWGIDPDRVAVILGNALGGEQHYLTTMRILFPEFARDLGKAPSFASLPADVRTAIVEEWHRQSAARLPEINEDTMPGELANIMAGRVASLFSFRGPNFITDAACASALAAMSSAVQGLSAGHYDAVITGGVDRNMGVNAFVKFCKIGALSATGTRPFDAGADGFVMGEGAAMFVLKRLADAERAGDRIYAVLLGLGGSSDGRGKGITAPNPVGQRLAIERAWTSAGVDPSTVSLVEAHGTSTRVGDSTELGALTEVLVKAGAVPGTVALGSVKSNIGHLKAAAGAAGFFKAVMALHEKVLPPSLNFRAPNPAVDWDGSPLRVNTELRDWPAPPAGVRRAGVSAFGFGGTDYHAVLEEYIPGHHRGQTAPRTFASAQVTRPSVTAPASAGAATSASPARPPLRGALVVGGADDSAVIAQLERVAADAATGWAPPLAAPDPALASAAVRVAIDHAGAADLAAKAGKAVAAFRSGAPAMWKMLRAQGVFVGRGPAPKVAFLYTGQGSQYVNMIKGLRALEPVVAETFDEADRIMAPLLGRPLSSCIFIDTGDPGAVAALEQQLLQTEITQPAVLATDLALTRMLNSFGVYPDMVMGHSLGEYGALVAAGALTFGSALEAVSARGHEMASLSLADNGAMAAVFGPLADIERIVRSINGNVVIANINSFSQAVVGGATDAVTRAIKAFEAAGMNATRIPVSHAFHTSIVAPVSEPLKVTLRRLDLRAPTLPIVANVTGDFYPAHADTEVMLDILGRQVASPVQFVRGLNTLYDAGARVFVEVGPKKALHGFVEDVLGASHDDVLALFTNHPKNGDVPSLNAALCGLWASGLGYAPRPAASAATAAPAVRSPNVATHVTPAAPTAPAAPPRTTMSQAASTTLSTADYTELGRLVSTILERGMRAYAGTALEPAAADPRAVPPPAVSEPVVITGAALGLPGVEHVFDDENLQRILDGQQFIDTIPHRFRQQLVDLNITRLIKRESGDPTFETISDEADVVKLAGRHAPLDVVEEYGIDPARDAALDSVTRLAIGAGFDALRDAGIPLVMRYKTTTLGSSLPERWGLPDALRDDTGVIFASAFPGYDSFATDLERYYTDRGHREQLMALEGVRSRMHGDEPAIPEIDRRIAGLRHKIDTDGFTFDRRFLFRCLSMGHSQFAEIIGARGPNTQVNAACASTTQAMAVAEDWIRAGRCRRVVVVSADDITSETLLPWMAAGFLASGAAATDDAVADAATPFDRRRHGMIIGMGAAAIVVESAEAARERGLQPICELLGSVTANSAFHGTRLDVDHIALIMEQVVGQAESRGVDRTAIAASTVFVSHETYTPARGGSAAAEINALRTVFGAGAGSVVIANTKGFTGHAMGAGIEDVVAIKALETGVVPPVPNFKEPDPDLGDLNLSQGGSYPVDFALRLAAGFGSQIAMSLLRRTPVPDGRRRAPSELGYAYRIVDPQAWQRWLDAISGHPAARLEVTTRRLRVVDEGAPGMALAAGPSTAGAVPKMSPPAVSVAPPAAAPPVTAAPVAAEPVTVPPVAAVPVAAVPVAAEPVAAEPVAAEPAPAPPEAVAGDEVADAVVGIVAEMTGYPRELLDLDLDLEADLGVDTVKQAEVFAAVRARFGVERDDSLVLREFPTLAHVIGWIRGKTGTAPGGTSAGVAAPQAIAPAGTEIHQSTVTGDLDAVDRLPRRVPVPVLRPALSQCLPTGVTLGDGARVVVMHDEGGVAKALVERLTKARVSVLELEPGSTTDALLSAIEAWRAEGPVTGVYWLAALDDEGPHGELDLTSWQEGLRRRVKALYATMRRLYDDSPFLITATRLGGYHGYDDAGATAPMGGAVTGFAKAYQKERPEALVKAVDLAVSRRTAQPAQLLIDETLRDPGCVEVGYAGGMRWGVGLAERPFPPQGQPGEGALTLGPDSVVLVTGAAGSIVSAITADLAKATGATFHLLDLTPAPDAADPDLRRYLEDREGLKTDLAQRLRDRGDRPTPVAIDKELARFERLAAAAAAVEAVTAAGGTAHYYSVDLTDADAVGRVLTRVRGTSSRIDLLLHAAGLEVSRALPDKAPAEFDLVFGVKTDGWFNVLHGAGDLPIGATVAFSSVAGRFGNAGQADYSAANDLLCKIASSARRTRPGSRALALDWTAWGGIGMATRGSIPKIMEMAGVEMLPAEAGVAWIRRELTAHAFAGEVVVAGELGQMTGHDEPTGGLDPAAVRTAEAGPMVGHVVTADVLRGLVVQTTLDPVAQPFLDHHRIDGTAVLPGVMGMEAFAEVARLLTPDRQVAAIEDVDFRAPLKFYRDEPRTLTVTALLRPDGDDIVADCSLAADRLLPGSAKPQTTVYFTGSVRLSAQARDLEAGTPVHRAADAPAVAREDVYRLYFHGPAYQVVAEAWQDHGAAAARLAAGLPPNHEPAGLPTVLGPRLVELCFQTAGLWEAGRTGRLALPAHVGRVLLGTGTPTDAAAGVVAVARAVTSGAGEQGGFDCTVLDAEGRVILRVEDYRTVALPAELPAGIRVPLEAVMAGRGEDR